MYSKGKEKAFPRQREGRDTSAFGECDASVNGKVSQSPANNKEVKCYMAERRMFSQKVVQSARFLKMPKSTQCLYFHLGLRADDDGVVEAYSVMNLIKADEDDLRILVAKGFVKILNEDLVTYLIDWPEQNKIRADRKQDSRYKPLLLEMMPDLQLQEKTERSDTRKKRKSGQSMDGPWPAQYRVVEDSSGKDSVGKDSTGKGSGSCTGKDPPGNAVITAAATATTVPEKMTEKILFIPQKDESGLMRFSLGNESISEAEYQALLRAHRKEYVDDVIRRILETPYMNCLNLETIEQWVRETEQRMAALSSLPARQIRQRISGRNSFHNFPQRTYDYDALERQLLRTDNMAVAQEG